MPEYTQKQNMRYDFPYINVLEKYIDGVLYAYELTPYEGYVIYDKNAATGKEKAVTRYRKRVTLPAAYNFNNFSYAVKNDFLD